MLNVLIVEDDLTIADMLQEALEIDGYRVSGIARTVGEAIEAAERHNLDFAVIDIHLANRGLGTEVAAHFRRTTTIGILFSTGNDNGDLTALLGDAVMTKPYRQSDVGRGLKIIGEVARFGQSQLASPRNFRLLTEAINHSTTASSG
jgi:DNA-binding response OmpR family regulator